MSLLSLEVLSDVIVKVLVMSWLSLEVLSDVIVKV
jgi:hypothetical protein